MVDWPNPSGSEAPSLLEERAKSALGFEPWLFFPRGWEWPWLSYAESWRCVSAWAAELENVSEHGIVLGIEEKAPEGLLLELAGQKAGWGFDGAEADLESDPRRTFEYQDSAIRPQLMIGPCPLRPLNSTLPDQPLPNQRLPEKRFELPLDRAGKQRDIVLCSGGRVPIRLVEAVLEAGAALVVEPEPRYLASGLALRPTVLVLGPRDVEPLGRTIDQATSKKTRRRLRRATERLRLVVQNGVDVEPCIERLAQTLAVDGNMARPRLVVLEEGL